MSPKLVDHNERRRQIGFTALDHFARKGFAATSMSQVAMAAGVGKGTVYEYFQSKDDLIGFALALYVQRIEERVGRMLAGIASPRERIRKYLFEVMETFTDDPRSMGLLLSISQMLVAGTGAAGRTDLLRGMFERARQTIAAIIKDGVADGVFRPGAGREAETIAINMIAYLDGIWIHSLISPGKIDIRLQIDAYLDLLFAAIDLAPATGTQAQEKHG